MRNLIKLQGLKEYLSDIATLLPNDTIDTTPFISVVLALIYSLNHNRRSSNNGGPIYEQRAVPFGAEKGVPC